MVWSVVCFVSGFIVGCVAVELMRVVVFGVCQCCYGWFVVVLCCVCVFVFVVVVVFVVGVLVCVVVCLCCASVVRVVPFSWLLYVMVVLYCRWIGLLS